MTIQEPPPSSSSAEETTPEQALADCLLDQFPFFLGGAGLGTVYSLSRRKKNVMPLLFGGMAGSVADLVYGYTVKCVSQVEAIKRQQKPKE